MGGEAARFSSIDKWIYGKTARRIVAKKRENGSVGLETFPFLTKLQCKTKVAKRAGVAFSNAELSRQSHAHLRNPAIFCYLRHKFFKI